MDFSALTIFDMTVIGIVFLSTLIAFFKGFIQSLLSLVVWVGAGVLSLFLYPVLEPQLASYFSNQIVARTIAMFVTYIGLLILLGIAAIPISNMAKPISRGVIDRTLGMAFGLARGVAFVVVIFLSIVLSYSMVKGVAGEETDTQEQANYKAPKWMKESETYSLLSTGADFTMDIIPKDAFDQAMNSMGDFLPKTTKPKKTKLDLAKEGELFKSLRNQATNDDGTLKKEWISGLENAKNSAEETGYRDDQIQQIDRLIQQVQP